MDKELPHTNFAFDVDLERMEGRFLFDTEKVFQKAAEKILLERCKYKFPINTTTTDTYFTDLEIDSSPILGLSPNGAMIPRGDTITTLLATKTGFVCQLNPVYWEDVIYHGEGMYVMTMEREYPIKVMNSPFDVLIELETTSAPYDALLGRLAKELVME